MIKPTVGRVVWFTPNKAAPYPYVHGFDQPLAAIIAHVHSDKMVNLAVFDSNGVAYSVTSVDLIQDGEPKPEGGFYCEWMPYQKGQAAKSERLQKQLADYVPEKDKRFHALALANCHGDNQNVREAPDKVIARAKQYLTFLDQADEPQPAPEPMPIRFLTDHVVNNANKELTVAVMDGPGAGGASHHYHITGFDTGSNPSCPFKRRHGQSAQHATILFQNGPIQESGVNGITHEVLLAILADRLRSFQVGPYQCEENAAALVHIESARLALMSRTMKRQERGVEGTHAI